MLYFLTFCLGHLESFNSTVYTRKKTWYIEKQSQTPSEALNIVLAIFQKTQTCTEEVYYLNVSCLPPDNNGHISPVEKNNIL